MNRVLLTAGLLVSLIVSATPSSAATQRQNEAEIREVQVRQAEAWNRHDAAAYASLFSDDGDVVNVVGWWWRGRRAIENKLIAAFSFVFRESIMTITDVDVRFLNPAIAIAHVHWTMVGAKTPPGVPEPRQGIQLQVLKKQGGKWLIASFQNTNSVPEAPFPTGPPPSAGAKP